MAIPKVYADFQKLDDFNRLQLTCAGTLQDLKRHGIQLQEGMVLTFYMDDADEKGRPGEMTAGGTVHYDAAAKSWVAEIDWDAIRHESDSRADDANETDGLATPVVPPSPAKRHE